MNQKTIELRVDISQPQIDSVLSKIEQLAQVLQEAKSLVNDLASCKLNLEFDVQS